MTHKQYRFYELCRHYLDSSDKESNYIVQLDSLLSVPDELIFEEGEEGSTSVRLAAYTAWSVVRGAGYRVGESPLKTYLLDWWAKNG